MAARATHPVAALPIGQPRRPWRVGGALLAVSGGAWRGGYCAARAVDAGHAARVEPGVRGAYAGGARHPPYRRTRWLVSG